MLILKNKKILLTYFSEWSTLKINHNHTPKHLLIRFLTQFEHKKINLDLFLYNLINL
jgi:hypothetical protein